METISIPGEKEIKDWIKEALNDYFTQAGGIRMKAEPSDEALLNRQQIADKLNISLVTLADWVKRGLPYFKNRGKVYFLYSEVFEYIKEKRMGKYKLMNRLIEKK